MMRAGSIALRAAIAIPGLCLAQLPSDGTAPPSPPTEILDFGSAVATDMDILAFGKDHRARMTIPVTVSGQGPYPFIVDTGAERTVIARELARRLELGQGRVVRVHSMTGPERVATAVVPEIRISKSTFTDIQAPALSGINIGAAGIIGVDSLQQQRVIFDFVRKTMTMSPSVKKPETWGPDVIVVTGQRLHGRLIIVDAKVDGEKITVVVDTGAELSIGNNVLRRKLEERRRLRRVIPVSLISVTGERFMVDYTAVRSISLGDVVIQNMPIGFAEVHPFERLNLSDTPAILLGMDALRLFEQVSIDFERKQVRFLSPSLNRAGIRFGKRSIQAPAALSPILAATTAANLSTLSSDRPAMLKRPDEAM
jgi:predicted aspartyl protease